MVLRFLLQIKMWIPFVLCFPQTRLMNTSSTTSSTATMDTTSMATVDSLGPSHHGMNTSPTAAAADPSHDAEGASQAPAPATVTSLASATATNDHPTNNEFQGLVSVIAEGHASPNGDVVSHPEHPHTLTRTPSSLLSECSIGSCGVCSNALNSVMDVFCCIPCDFNVCLECQRTSGSVWIGESSSSASVICKILAPHGGQPLEVPTTATGTIADLKHSVSALLPDLDERDMLLFLNGDEDVLPNSTVVSGLLGPGMISLNLFILPGVAHCISADGDTAVHSLTQSGCNLITRLDLAECSDLTVNGASLLVNFTGLKEIKFGSLPKGYSRPLVKMIDVCEALTKLTFGNITLETTMTEANLSGRLVLASAVVVARFLLRCRSVSNLDISRCSLGSRGCKLILCAILGFKHLVGVSEGSISDLPAKGSRLNQTVLKQKQKWTVSDEYKKGTVDLIQKVSTPLPVLANLNISSNVLGGASDCEQDPDGWSTAYFRSGSGVFWLNSVIETVASLRVLNIAHNSIGAYQTHTCDEEEPPRFTETEESAPTLACALAKSSIKSLIFSGDECGVFRESDLQNSTPVTAMSTMKELHASDKAMYSSGTSLLAAMLWKCDVLTDLDISRNGISNACWNHRWETHKQNFHGLLAICKCITQGLPALSKLTFSGDGLNRQFITCGQIINDHQSQEVTIEASMTTADLSRNNLQATGAMVLFAFLQNQNCSITTLDVRENGIKWDLQTNEVGVLTRNRWSREPEQPDQQIAGLALCAAIRTNTTLTKFDISMSRLFEGVEHLAAGLLMNQTLVILDISQNGLGPAESIHIASVIKSNVLTSLTVSENALARDGNTKGIEQIIDALETNTSLTSLHVGMNCIARQDMERLMALVDSSSLVLLCGVPIRELQGGTVTDLNLSKTCLGAEGAFVLEKYLSTVNTSLLTALDISDNCIARFHCSGADYQRVLVSTPQGPVAVQSILEHCMALRSVNLLRNDFNVPESRGLIQVLESKTGSVTTVPLNGDGDEPKMMDCSSNAALSQWAWPIINAGFDKDEEKEKEKQQDSPEVTSPTARVQREDEHSKAAYRKVMGVLQTTKCQTKHGPGDAVFLANELTRCQMQGVNLTELDVAGNALAGGGDLSGVLAIAAAVLNMESLVKLNIGQNLPLDFGNETVVDPRICMDRREKMAGPFPFAAGIGHFPIDSAILISAFLPKCSLVEFLDLRLNDIDFIAAEHFANAIRNHCPLLRKLAFGFFSHSVVMETSVVAAKFGNTCIISPSAALLFAAFLPRCQLLSSLDMSESQRGMSMNAGTHGFGLQNKQDTQALRAVGILSEALEASATLTTIDISKNDFKLEAAKICNNRCTAPYMQA